MFEGVLNTPVFRLDLVMFCVIITIWLVDNLPSFEYFRKTTLTTCLWKARRDRFTAFNFVNTIQHPHTLKNSIYHLSKRGLPPFFNSGTNSVLGQVLAYSLKKIHLVVATVKLAWLLFLNIVSFNFELWTTNFRLLSNKQIS